MELSRSGQGRPGKRRKGRARVGKGRQQPATAGKGRGASWRISRGPQNVSSGHAGLLFHRPSRIPLDVRLPRCGLVRLRRLGRLWPRLSSPGEPSMNLSRTVACLAALLSLNVPLALHAQDVPSPRDGWDFAMQDFLIGVLLHE